MEHKIKHDTAGIYGQIVQEMKKVSHYANIEKKKLAGHGLDTNRYFHI